MTDLAATRIDVGDGIELRAYIPGDAEASFAAIDASREYIGAWLDWVEGSRAPSDVGDFISRSIEGYESGDALNLAIVVDGTIVGGTGFNRIEQQHRAGEIGYWLGEAHGGRGVMTRSAAALTNFGFEMLGLHRIEIRADAANVRSRAVPERLGYTLEPTLRDHRLHRDEFIDTVIYAMLEGDWPREG